MEETKLSEEVYDDTPDYVEPSKEITVNGLQIVLVNELIQVINDNLQLSFRCENNLVEIQTAFGGFEGPITYGDQSYQGYSEITELGYKLDSKKQTVYRIMLAKPAEEISGLTEDQNYAISFAVAEMPDSDAVKHMTIFPNWEVGKEYEVGDRVQLDGLLWKCRQKHTSQEDWKPGIDAASLWESIDVEHAGTKDDPIPYAQTMAVESGKYYAEDNIVYKCIRDSGQPLYTSCASLVGNYFEVAE